MGSNRAGANLHQKRKRRKKNMQTREAALLKAEAKAPAKKETTAKKK